MSRIVLTVLLAAGCVGAGAAGAATPPVKATLSGTCTVANTLDHNGVVTRSTLTCKASGACACEGATRLAYQSATVSPGNGAAGREKGTLTASGPRGVVTLALVGTRTGVGLSTGSWTLGPVSGAAAAASLARRGSYETETTTLKPILGTTSSTVRISAAIGCWSCQPRG